MKLVPATLITLAACTTGSDDAAPIPTVDTTDVSTPVVDEQVTTSAPTDSVTPPGADTVAADPPETATTAPSEAPTTAAPTTQAPAPTTTIVEFDRMRPGDEGPRIGIVQLKLIVLGYLPAGSESGVFDDATADAVRRFQADYSIFVDGVVGPQTDRSLTAAAESVNVDG